MSNHISHAALPYPVKNARFTVLVPYLDADGDPTDPTTPDTEVSQDAGAFADAAEEVTTISGSNGGGYITLTGAETNNSAVMVAFKVASGPKATLMTLYPRVLPILLSGTASAGASGSITLAAGAYDLTGCIVRTTGGTGGGGTGGANNQARMITAYNTSTLVATVVPNWETTPSSDTTYDVLLTDLAVNSPLGRFLRPATDGRTIVVDSSGLADANAVKLGPTGSGTAQTARDIGASVLLSSGTGTGQLDFTSGVVKGNVTKWNGTAVPAEHTAGYPIVTVKDGTGTGEIDTSSGVVLAKDHTGANLATASALATVQSDTDDIQTRLPAALVGGRMDSSVGAMAANVVTAAAINDGAIDRATFAADTGLQTTRSNTAQAGASTTITLDASASATDDFYNNQIVYLTGGTGVGQARFITDYVGSTKVATVTAWATNPDNTSTFAILPFDAIPGASAPSASTVASAVWGTALPGSFGAGEAGRLVGRSLPDVTAGGASGLLISGANTGPLSVSGGVTFTNSGGDGFTCSSSGSNGAGIAASGNGTGAAVKATGGATGSGLEAIGGATSGSAIKATGTAGNAAGLELVGQGSNHGLKATGGATGDGARLAAGATSGDGLRATGGADGHGARFNSGSAASNYGILAAGNGSTGAGMFAQQTAGNGDGLKASGLGTGSGFKPTGGATGHGILATGGATSGDGINATGGGAGDGMELVGTGGEVDLDADIAVTTVTDKTGYSLSAGGIQAIWDALTSALTTAGSIGKYLVDKLVFLTGDAYVRLGAPAGASVSADIAAVKAETATILSDTNDIQTRLPAALVGGRMDSSVGAMAADVITSTALAASAVNEIVDQTWEETLADHSGTSGSTAEALAAAGAAGDPWSTAVPGAYGAGTAGSRLGRIPDVAAGAAGGLFIAGTNAPVTITGSGDALTLTSTGGNGSGLNASGNGTGSGVKGTGGATGHGLLGTGGATSGSGLRGVAAAGNGHGLEAVGQGSGSGLRATAGATGAGAHLLGGATSGDGLRAEAATSGDGFEAVGAGGGLDINADEIAAIYSRLGAPAGASVSVDVAAIKTDTAAIKAKTDNLPPAVKKNTALAKFMFLLVDSVDHVTPKTGVTVTSERSLDGAAFGSCTNTAVEVASGWYYLDLAAGDLNGNIVALKFTGSGADARNITIVTQA